MERKRNKILNILVVAILLAVTIFSSVFNLSSFLVSHAQTSVSGYSNVLKDLQKDENFNIEDYPSIEDDYSLQVIQIAETKGGEVLVYVYQPSAETRELVATKISVSQTILGNYSPELYDLTLLNSDGVFQKYRIDGLEILAGQLRYYEISEIMRAWNEEIDKAGTGGNIVEQKAYPVAQRWAVCTLNGETFYDCQTTEIVEIKDYFVGFVEYEDGLKLGFHPINGACQSHFIAFNSDHKMDELLEADITFTHQTRAYYDSSAVSFSPTFGTAVNVPNLTLNASDKVDYITQGTFTHSKYDWNRIETPAQFFEKTKTNKKYNIGVVDVKNKRQLVEADENIIKGMQYVLRFFESPYTSETKLIPADPITGTKVPVDYVKETLVTNVAILRLKFVYEGKVYNLGVVGDMAHGDGHSSSYEEWSVEIAEWFKILLIVLGVLFLLVGIILVLNVLGWLIPVFKFLLKVVKGIWFVVSSPFTFIKSMIKKE